MPRVGSKIDALEYTEKGIYSALFLDYDEFQRIDFSAHQPCFFVMRDIRDTLVSLYFSHRYSHVENEEVKKTRRVLESMDEQEGMLYIFENNWEEIARIQTSWVRSGKHVYRYEDLFMSQGQLLEKIFNDVGFKVPKSLLRKAIKKNAFEAKFNRKPSEVDIYSHGRTGMPGDWQNHRNERLDDFIEKCLFPVLAETGYEI
jgi:lipopolysaccharide transport system ATP-binding protein